MVGSSNVDRDARNIPRAGPALSPARPTCRRWSGRPCARASAFRAPRGAGPRAPPADSRSHPRRRRQGPPGADLRELLPPLASGARRRRRQRRHPESPALRAPAAAARLPRPPPWGQVWLGAGQRIGHGVVEVQEGAQRRWPHPGRCIDARLARNALNLLALPLQRPRLAPGLLHRGAGPRHPRAGARGHACEEAGERNQGERRAPDEDQPKACEAYEERSRGRKERAGEFAEELAQKARRAVESERLSARAPHPG